MAREKDENVRHSTDSETTTSQTRSWLIKAIENTVIEPRCRQVVIRKLDTEGRQPSFINLYGTRDGTNGMCSSRASTHASTKQAELTADVTTRPHSEAPRDSAYVMITNFSNEALTVPKAAVLGIAKEISESIVNKIN